MPVNEGLEGCLKQALDPMIPKELLESLTDDCRGLRKDTNDTP